MFAQVTRLQFWKSEHDETTCEDTCQDDCFRGLFALSDGAGTTLFSAIWAQILVDHFLTSPLLSDDPFETEFWLRQAQEIHKTSVSTFGMLPWNVLQKVQNEGSQATLATLRIVETHTASARACLLALGDSCIFVEQASTGQVISFPLKQEKEFERAPVCFPSKLSIFERSFHVGQMMEVDLKAGDSFVLTCDAVARWIISAGKGHYANVADALHAVVAQTPQTWEAFVLDCRKRDEMVDDDSTALVVSLYNTPGSQGSYLLLGATVEHNQVTRVQRNALFTQASQEQNKELMAIYYGDGQDLEREGVILPPEQVQHIRQVADALHEVLMVLRAAINRSDVVACITPIWQKYASVLGTEVCAEPLRQTLTRLGLPVLAVSAPALPSLPAEEVSALPIPPPQAPSRPLPSDEDSPQELAREREKLELEKRFFHALRAEDDELILAAHQAILQSALAQEIVLSIHDERLIVQAEQRSNIRRFVLDALAQGNIQRMAHAYAMIQQTPLALLHDELKRLELAHTMYEACNKQNDAQLITALEDILRSPYHSSFAFSAEEENLIAQAWQRYMQRMQLLRSDEPASPTISEAWFQKICAVKQLYLQYTRQPALRSEELQARALEDLVNDQYIQEAIEEIRRKPFNKMLTLEHTVKKEFEAFRACPLFDYVEACQRYHLSDEDVYAALYLFLRAYVFSQYLKRKHLSFHAWLDKCKQERRRRFLSSGESREEERSGLLWWRR